MDNNIECHLKIDLLPSNLGAFKSETEIVEVLKKQFEKIIKAKYREIDLLMPKRLRVGELKRYLEVYDYKKQGLKWNDIIKRLDISRSYPVRESMRDNQHAKKIIENVEQGIFPGKYTPKYDR